MLLALVKYRTKNIFASKTLKSILFKSSIMTYWGFFPIKYSASGEETTEIPLW